MAIGYKVVKGSATKARARRHFRLRKRVSGTAERPRLVVARSARHLFVKVVDDTSSTTLAYASTMEKELRTFSGDKTAKAKQVGELIAKRAKEKGISAVVFDRGVNKFHGRVAAVATSARANGLGF